MLRREFLVRASSVPLTCSAEEQKPPSVKDAIRILEAAVRRELVGVKEIRVEFEPDERKSIALLFAVVRSPVTVLTQPTG
jgi:hypothetical protein